jgi:hypothetical protein
MSAMASSHAARRTSGGLRLLTRAFAITGTLVAATALPLAAGPATSQAARVKLTAKSAPDQPQAQSQMTLSVTSVSPSYATPRDTITLNGRVWNEGRSAISDLSVGLTSSAIPFPSQTALEGFAAGTMPVGGLPVAVAPKMISKLRARQGVGWTIKLPVSALRLGCFGVYPLNVTLAAAGTLIGTEPVPMPFWPAKTDSCLRPTPFPISWIWPLIDSPHQGPCPGLLDNSLAASLAPGGRLASLLAVGASYSASAHLTWAIDPALLDNARTMTQSYPVGDSATCSDSTTRGPDQNARTWLRDVAKGTANQPVFVTPYADVDVAGLALEGDTPDLKKAFVDGESLAGPILGRSRFPAPIPAGPKQLSAIAWPPGGVPSQAMIEKLGAIKMGTVILAMPPPRLSFTPGAVTSTNDFLGSTQKVLLGDYSLSNVLASSAARSRLSSAVFSVSQLFLAETAMIVAEAPSDVRPIVVTPPRRWDPAKPLATSLLSDTSNAPWLRTQTVAQIARQPESRDNSLVLSAGGSQLPATLLHQVSKLDNSVALLQSITVGANSRLNHAVFGIESSQWAAPGAAAQARKMLTRASRFVTKQFSLLSVGGQKVSNVTLGGRTGPVAVSIDNASSYPVKVGLQVTSSNDTVIAKQRNPHAVYEVLPHSSTGLKLSINAAQTGKATLSLRLKSPNGTLLPNPPDKPLIMKISVTNLGTVALVIFVAALAIFVVASAAQAIRGGRPGAFEPAEPDDAPSPAGASAGASPDDASDSGEDPADAHAQATDRAGQDSPARPDRADNVIGDRSELSSLGRRPMKESR